MGAIRAWCPLTAWPSSAAKRIEMAWIGAEVATGAAHSSYQPSLFSKYVCSNRIVHDRKLALDRFADQFGLGHSNATSSSL